MPGWTKVTSAGLWSCALWDTVVWEAVTLCFSFRTHRPHSWCGEVY